MIKKLLFILTIALAGTISAQTFELQDDQNVNIGGTSITIYGTGPDLSYVKFHVKNLTGTTADYTCDVQEMANILATDLQVCYGTNCFIANGGVPTLQVIGGSSTVAGGATDVTFKVAPFSFGWVAGDEATWRIVVRNVANANDTASAIVTYKVMGVSVDEVSSKDVSINAYPNPATNLLNINYSIKGAVNNARIDVYDVLGQKVSTHALINNQGQLNLAIENLNSGVYFYAIKVGDKTIKTERVIVK